MRLRTLRLAIKGHFVRLTALALSCEPLFRLAAAGAARRLPPRWYQSPGYARASAVTPLRLATHEAPPAPGAERRLVSFYAKFASIRTIRVDYPCLSLLDCWLLSLFPTEPSGSTPALQEGCYSGASTLRILQVPVRLGPKVQRRRTRDDSVCPCAGVRRHATLWLATITMPLVSCTFISSRD